MTEQSAAVARIASIANLFDKRRAAVGINVARLELAQMVESAETELAQLRADLALAQAERDAATRRAEQAEAVLSEQADIITANLWHIPPEYAARNILLDVAMKMRAALAGPEGGPQARLAATGIDAQHNNCGRRRA